VENTKLNGTPFISTTTEPSNFIFKDGKYKNVWIEEELTMFNFKSLGTFMISNHSFENINWINSFDESSTLISINSFNVENSTQGVISDINITNSTVSVMKMNSIFGAPTELKLFAISNIKYLDSSFPSFRSLITTFGIFGNINLSVSFTNLTFKNIDFKVGGEVIHIQHLIPSPVQILSSTFQNITAGRIKIKTNNKIIDGMKTEALFRNWEFLFIKSTVNSFFSVETDSIVKIISSNFNKFSSTNKISGIFNTKTNSLVNIFDS